jgi:hypothetical protein
MSIHTIILTVEVDTIDDENETFNTAEAVAQSLQHLVSDEVFKSDLRSIAKPLSRVTAKIIGGRSADALCGACRCNAVAHHPDNCLVGCLTQGCGCSRTQLTA